MDGVHDLGGLEGFGSVDAPATEPAFAEGWERRAFRASMAMMIGLRASGGWFRHSIERMTPEHYLTSSYYEHWLTGLSTLLVESGRVTSAELDTLAGGHFPLSRPDRGARPDDPGDDRNEPRFAVGGRVRVREWHPPGHTRAPRYVQGKRGVVTRIDGPYAVPDFEPYGLKIADPTYSVRFDARELWGEGGESEVTVHVGLWERYLEEDA